MQDHFSTFCQLGFFLEKRSDMVLMTLSDLSDAGLATGEADSLEPLSALPCPAAGISLLDSAMAPSPATAVPAYSSTFAAMAASSATADSSTF